MSKKAKKAHKEYHPAKIKVIGIGGGGTNAVSRMHNNFPKGVDLIVINTDVQDLKHSKAKKRIHIGKKLTRGLGTGMNPDLGHQSAEENRNEIAEALKGADMVFIAAGFGGGTGTGGSPVVAEVAKELGILTVAVVTKPFSFEGIQRARIAQEGILKLRDKVDTLIVIPNDRIFSLIDKNTSLSKAFEKIDEILKNSVLGITELITMPGVVNVDFADIKAVMQEAGSAVIGIGEANGQERCVAAAKQAVKSPLLEASIEGARGVLFSVSGHRDLKMNELNEIAGLIAENVDQSAKIIFGAYYDRKLKKGQLKVTLIATGFDGSFNHRNDVLAPGIFAPKLVLEDRLEPDVNEEEEESFKDGRHQELKFTESKKKERSGSVKNKIDTGVNGDKQDDFWDIPAFLRKKKKRK